VVIEPFKVLYRTAWTPFIVLEFLKNNGPHPLSLYEKEHEGVCTITEL